MVRMVRAVYEDGVLKPLERLDLPEHLVLDISFEIEPTDSDSSDGTNRLIQLKGVLRDHPIDDLDAELRRMRKQAWTHVEAESADA